MRVPVAIAAVLASCLLTALPVHSEELQVTKVYRDYPGYVNPAVCENPNVDKAAPPLDDSRQGVAAICQDRPEAPASAPYLGVWAGAVATHDTDIDASAPGDVEVEFDAGYAFGVAAGYDFGPARLEIEAAHRRSDVDKAEVDGSSFAADGELTVQTLMVNGLADFPTGGSLTPYLGAGVGYAQVELEDEDDGVLAGQLLAGVLYAVTPQVAIDIGYRFMMTDDPELHGVEFEVRQHTVAVGLHFRF